MLLFNEYKNAGKLSEAVLIGRNLFNKTPSDDTIFNEYFEFLCSLAESLPVLYEKKDFAEQASIILAFYSENANLDNNIMYKIKSCQERINTVFKNIESAEAEERKKLIATIHKENGTNLKELILYKDKLRKTTTQEQFENVLAEIGDIDVKIDKDMLTDEHTAIYEKLTKEHTDVISEKMRDLEYMKNVSYNKTAVDSFALAFKQFKDEESKYKNQSQLFTLVSKTLFAYDASRLFNETLIYYNHVYSYILSKLDDDGKLALTRYSIECERKLR